MILTGIRNQEIEIKVYTNNSGYSDSDWLRVYLNVKSDFGNWETVDESLTVSEFKELIQWFKDLSENKEVVYKDLYFTEPNLEFSLKESNNYHKKIRIIFSAESRAKSAKEEDIFIEFDFSNEDLFKIACNLEVELKTN